MKISSSLHSKIVFIVLGLVSLSALVWFYVEFTGIKRDLINKKVWGSMLVAHPIANDIITAMTLGRPDMVRYSMDRLKDVGDVEGVEFVTLLRNNGFEEAFKDLSTLEAVKKKRGSVPDEWWKAHEDVKENKAIGTDTAAFKDAFAKLELNWGTEPVYYIAENGLTMTYLQPIEEVESCLECHEHGGARGVIMVRTSFRDVHEQLAWAAGTRVFSALIAIGLIGVLLSVLIRKTITGPLQRTVKIIGEIEEKGDMTKRLEVTSYDEIGYLSTEFNNMIDSLEKREKENKELLWTIAKAKKEWESTFDAIGDLISIHDKEFNILRVNKAFVEMFGHDESYFVGKKCYKIFHDKDEPLENCPHKKSLEDGIPDNKEFYEPTLKSDIDVTTFPLFDKDGDVTASVHVVKDITEGKMLKEQLIHSEKMSSLGKFVAGIAHELNNPLTGIMGFSQLLMDTPDDKPVKDIKDKLGKIYKESVRTSKILQNLLTFSSIKEPKRDSIDVNRIVRETIELKEMSLKDKGVELTTDLEENLPITMVDFYQIQQVFVNLVNNAADAVMENEGEKKIDIATHLNGRIIEVIFADNGSGIPSHVVDKIFDPFFTTKEVGKGTGLGLSVCHTIIKEHYGWIDVRPREGGGTVIAIELPVVTKGLASGAGSAGPISSGDVEGYDGYNNKIT